MSILLIDLKCNSPQAHFGGQEELGAVASHSFWWAEAISEQELKAVQSSQSSLNSLQASSVPLVYYWGLYILKSVQIKLILRDYWAGMSIQAKGKKKKDANFWYLSVEEKHVLCEEQLLRYV